MVMLGEITYWSLLVLKGLTIILMHVYVRRADFTTKPHFEIARLRSFAQMNSQGSRIEKNTHAQRVQRVQMQKNCACKQGLVVKFACLM